MMPPVHEMSSPSSTTSTLDEPFETPVFEEVFGLDLSCFEHQRQQQQQQQQQKKKPILNLSDLSAFDMNHDLPTPPADISSLKRRRTSSLDNQSLKKKQRPLTPPIDYFDPLPRYLIYIFF